MSKILANIDTRIILAAISKAKPLTVSGRNAITNYRRFASNNVVTAAGLEASISSLIQINDAGLEGFVNTLKGLMPVAKRKVAIAYEMLQMEPKGTLFKAGIEAENALAELYKHNAALIISEIAGGALDDYATNPTISALISYAKAATTDTEMAKKPEVRSSGLVETGLVPIINLASLGDNGMLVLIDGKKFVNGPKGSLSYIEDISVIEKIPADVDVLVYCMSQMELDSNMPNVLNLKRDYAHVLEKNLGIKSLSIDLIGSIDEMVIINGQSMGVDKAKSLLNANKDSIIANIITSEAAKEGLKLVNSILDIFEKYRGALVTGRYARRFRYNGNSLYVIKGENMYSIVVTVSGHIVATKNYDTVYELLADSNVIIFTDLHNTISEVFAEDMKSEVNTSTVRNSILQKLLEERKEYERLLSNIRENRDELDNMSDPNPDKINELDTIEGKVSASLKTVNSEIEKITK